MEDNIHKLAWYMSSIERFIVTQLAIKEKK